MELSLYCELRFTQLALFASNFQTSKNNTATILIGHLITGFELLVYMATVIILVLGCFCVCLVCCAHMLPVGGVVDPFSGCVATSTPAADQVDWQPFSASDTSSAASDCFVHASANSNAHRL